MAFKQTKNDYEYLETIVRVEDTIMFAADGVFELMGNPTKSMAEAMWVGGIEQWFEERRFDNVLKCLSGNQARRIRIIKERHNID